MVRGTLRAVGAGLAVLALGTGCTAGEPAAPEAQRVAASDGLAGEAAPAVAPRCSTATLRGRYLYEVHGDKRYVEGLLPYLEVGQEVYDGKGGVTNVHTDSATRKDSTTTATYTVDPSCRATVTYPSGLVHRLLVSPGGERFTSYDASPTGRQTNLDGGAERVADDGAQECSPGTLTGTYSYRARGFLDRAVHMEQGFETFDGTGSVTNAYTTSGVSGTEHLAGTYAVESDCRATVRYADGTTFTQYLSPDGEQFFWIQVAGFEADDAGGLFGGHERRVTTSTDPALSTPGA